MHCNSNVIKHSYQLISFTISHNTIFKNFTVRFECIILIIRTKAQLNLALHGIPYLCTMTKFYFGLMTIRPKTHNLKEAKRNKNYLKKDKQYTKSSQWKKILTLRNKLVVKSRNIFEASSTSLEVILA